VTDPIVVAVKAGGQADGVVAFVDRDVIAVHIQHGGADDVVPVQVGAIIPLPGYEHAWCDVIRTECWVGRHVHLMWIGQDGGGLMCASITTGDAHSLDYRALATGWAVPRADALRVHEIATEYQMAVLQGARSGEGGYGDHSIAAALRTETAALTGVSTREMSPTFFRANPGICFAILVILACVLGIAMHRDNQRVQEVNADTGSSSLRRGLRWALDLHLRFLRPSRRRREDPHA
jgi:hypothetical protein